MDWIEIFKRFLYLIEKWDQEHDGRWYSYYLASVRDEDIPELAALIQEAVLSYTACKPARGMHD